MNPNQIINMAIRMIVRTAMNLGINKGIDFLARRGKKTAEMTQADHAQAQKTRKWAHQLRRITQVTRRFMR